MSNYGLCSTGTSCFFVTEYTYHHHKGRCLNATGEIHSSGSWGNLSFLGFSYNSCFEPTAQFRFRANGAMLNLKRQGCLAGDYAAHVPGYNTDMFFLYVDSVSLDNAACVQNAKKEIYRTITQTAGGGLSVYYKGKHSSSFQTWCAERQYNSIEKKYYIGLTTWCYIYGFRRFFFGKFKIMPNKEPRFNSYLLSARKTICFVILKTAKSPIEKCLLL